MIPPTHQVRSPAARPLTSHSRIPKGLARHHGPNRLCDSLAPSSSTRPDLWTLDLGVCLHHRKIVFNGQIEVVIGKFEWRLAEQAIVADLLQQIARLAAAE